MPEASRRLPHHSARPLSVLWNGERVPGFEGDSVAAALYGHGIRTITRSRKFHEARGLSGSFVAGHVATLGDIPHCRLDRMAAADGQIVEMENVWPSTRLDLMCGARLLPRRLVRAGFEHPRFISDGSFAWKYWERFLWHMAGEAPPPPRADRPEIPGRRIRTGTLVVGGGPAGIEAATSAPGDAVLVTRSRHLGGLAFDPARGTSSLPNSVAVMTNHEVYALFDGGRIAMAASNDPQEPAVLIEAEEIVLATGAQSIPPLVPGAALPGVLDARTALHLAARYGVAPGERIVVIGTEPGRAVADTLTRLGCAVDRFIDASAVERIDGRSAVSSVSADGKRFPCDAVVHAGPWRPDPTLPFQAGADGDLRLLAGKLPSHIRCVGACAEPPEAVSMGRALKRSALACPCMDVTVDEILDMVDAGIVHVEEIKRRTTCGMGTCQGFPCWDYLAAIVAGATGVPVQEIGHPTYRPPRAALTLGQAAGMADLTEVER